MTIKKTDRIIVTGGTGFVGQHVITELKRNGYTNIFVPRSTTYDLRNPKQCKKLALQADAIIHLAANVGGIGYNRSYPADIFYDNASMAIHLLHEACRAKVKKFVAIGTVCSYPKYTPVPFLETSLWDGYPEETNAPYGLAKKMLLVSSQAYRTQYKFNSIFLLPVNIYGPHDNFNQKQSHVIPALIERIYQAKKNKLPSVIVWGSGNATREFVYVQDVARAIVLAFATYNKPDPINIGSGEEISIKNLVKKIAFLLHYRGEIVWDKTKPDGQPRRLLDTKRAQKEFGFTAAIPFAKGIKKTIEWYCQKHEK